MLNEDLVKTMMETVVKTYTDLLPLNAIWLNKPIRTSREVKRRITFNDLVKIDNGELVDCNDAPNAKILELFGNLQNTIFKIKVQSLHNNQESIIDI